MNASIPMEGVYSEFIQHHAADIVGEEGKEAFTKFAQISTLKQALAEKDSDVHECHVSRQGIISCSIRFFVRLHSKALKELAIIAIRYCLSFRFSTALSRCSPSVCFEKWKQFVLQESLEDYSREVNVDHLKARYEQGDMEVDVDYWGQAEGVEPVCVRQSFNPCAPCGWQRWWQSQ